MSPLLKDEKRLLLQIARKAVESAILEQPTPKIPEPSGNPAALLGAFVTLRCRGRLRGCIGRVASAEPLAIVIAECARTAALDDPRFPRMKPADLRELEIEVSVLSHPQRVTPEEVQPGIHGLIISGGEKRGVLLPQVAVERHWTRERFLDETCEKAGLASNAWRNPSTRVEVFTAEVFSESDRGASGGDNPPAGHDADAYSSSQKSPA